MHGDWAYQLIPFAGLNVGITDDFVDCRLSHCIFAIRYVFLSGDLCASLEYAKRKSSGWKMSPDGLANGRQGVAKPRGWGMGRLGKLSLHRVAETSSEMALGYQPFHSQVVNFGGDPPWLPQPALLCAGRLRFEMMARLLSVGHRMMILNERRPCTLVCQSLSNGQITGPSDEEMGYFLVDRRPEFFSVVLRQLAKPS